MLFDGPEQWIDRLSLNDMRRIPVHPAITEMLGNADLRLRPQITQEDERRLGDRFASRPAGTDDVPGFVPECGVNFDQFTPNPSFFLHFPQCAFNFCFSGFSMPLGKVQTIRVFHQEEFLDRLAHAQENTAGNE